MPESSGLEIDSQPPEATRLSFDLLLILHIEDYMFNEGLHYGAIHSLFASLHILNLHVCQLWMQP